VAIVTTLVVYAANSQGFAVRQLDLNDTGIWVSNDADGNYGRVNKSAAGLDGVTRPPGEQSIFDLDILQDGNVAVGWDRADAKLSAIDTVLVKSTTDGAAAVDPTSSVQLRGGTMAVMDRAGRVWAARYDATASTLDLSALDSTQKPLAELGLSADAAQASAALAVGDDGTVYVQGVNGRRITIAPAGNGLAKPVISDGQPRFQAIQLTSVGSAPVAYDTKTGELSLGDGRTAQLDPDPQTVLQQPGPDANSVLVATSTSLQKVDLGTAAVTQLDKNSSGQPANPVRMAGCSYAAWAGTPGRVIRACDNSAVEVPKVDRDGALYQPTFRINHSLILLNDEKTGRAFDLDSAGSLDNWKDVETQTRQDETDKKKQVDAADSQPKAHPDNYKVRPERTSILHVLDNDTDEAGGVLAITKIDAGGLPNGTTAEVSPDGQTVKFYLSDGVSHATFRYTMSNGHKASDAEVDVADAGTEENPPFRRANVKSITYPVASYGTVSIPVVGDWRDPECDPVVVESAADGESPVPVSGDGPIEFTAGKEETEVTKTITYKVSDGASQGVVGSVDVRVLARKSTAAVAAIAEPDIARGEVGKAITITPLANDIPGADPRDTTAHLALNGDVAKKANITVTTDEESGQVVVVPRQAGSYSLDYSAAYGNAKFTPGVIRVDALAAGSGNKPVTMPDQATIRGGASVMVDVLANDYDPAGGLLTVQSATPANADQLQVAVISGRWLRIIPQDDQLSPNPQAVHYTVTNGSQTVTGDVLVTQLAASDNDEVLLRDDTATVRNNDSVLIPVLKNDTSLSGAPLALVSNSEGLDHPGQLAVADPSKSAVEDQGDVGQAYVHGDQILYIAPTAVETAHQYAITYSAKTETGDPDSATVMVTVNPEPTADAPDKPPAPGPVEMRVVSGSRVSIPIPTTGQDPDGDSVTVTGIDSAPSLGRIVGISPNSLTYEAYPTAGLVGTDSFHYVVTDRYGHPGVGSIRVAVSAPGQTQPPVAVDDSVVASPGADVQVNVLANDYVSRDDSVSVAPLAQQNDSIPAGVSLAGDSGPIVAKAPGVEDQPVLVNYALVGNGGTGPSAMVKVTSQEGYDNPPIVRDQTAQVDGQDAKADLLANAWDVDGSVDDLEATVVPTIKGLTQVGSQIVVPMLDHSQVIPFHVKDKGGAMNAAVVYVPPIGAGAPQLKVGAAIAMDSAATASFAVADYIESPRGKVVKIASPPDIATAPDDVLDATVDDQDRFTLTSTKYIGPASVTLQVMDAASQTDEGMLKAVVTIPVQIGPKTPVLRCPSDPQVIVQGGEVKNLDISTLCHVWSPDPDSVAGLTYSASWDAGHSIDGVTATGGAHKVALQAAASAPDKSSGSLVIGIDGTTAKTATLTVSVQAAPRPKLPPVKIPDIRAGTAVPIPLKLTSKFIAPEKKILDVTQTSGGAADKQVNDADLTITPAATTSGTLVFRVKMTDLASDPERQSRWVTGTVTLVVYKEPGKPTPPREGPSVQSKQATLSWAQVPSNGASIDKYELLDSRNRQTTCASRTCHVTGLTNGEALTFTVRAHNKAGWGPWSNPSKQITPDTKPGAPSSVKVSDPQDGSVLVSWGAFKNEGSQVKKIHITWNGGGSVPVFAGTDAAGSKRVSGLNNNTPYTFTVAGENDYDIGPGAKGSGQSSGKPLGLSVAEPKQGASTGATTNVTVSWSLGSPNGPKPMSYSVVRSDGSKICSGKPATSCVDDTVAFDGKSYRYTVTAVNATGGAAHTSTGTSPAWAAVGTPDDWGSWKLSATGSNGGATLSYTVPPSRGGSSTVTLMNGNSEFKSLGSASTTSSTDDSYTASGLDNGSKYDFSLRVCNEEKRCSTSSTKSVTPFGPLSRPSVSASVSGTTVTASATADGNGATATLTVYVDGAKVGEDSGKGALHATGNKDVGYSHTATVTAKLTTGDTDPNRGDGGEDSTSVRTQDEPPPPKSVTVSKGAAHQDTGCTTSGCAWVQITTSNMSGSVSCTIYDSTSGAWDTANITAPMDHKQRWYYGYTGRSLWVVCGGVESNHMTW
jgi:hypothetical protein